MATKILSPEFLSPLTTVPQCTDNQFVSRRLFSQIRGRIGLKEIMEGILQGQSNDLIKSYRQTTQIEYKRSLLYSLQVVINRASFWNSPLLISSALGSDRKGLVTLLAENTIVPFLLKENSFEQEPTFDVLSRGREAVESLSRDPDLAEIVCVRLGGNDEQVNARKTDDLTINFRQQLTYFLDSDNVQERAQSIAAILLGSEGTYPSRADKRVIALAERLIEMARWIREERPSRNVFYQKFVTLGKSPADALYREDPFTFELKVWIDLIYNSNLPRHLGSLTFVPHNFPTPLDVGLIWPIQGQKKQAGLEEASEVLRDILERASNLAKWKTWDSIQQHADLSIPSPHDLTHVDIVEIRSWDEWKNMMRNMEKYLDLPLEEKGMHDFNKSYNEFLRKLSSWWLKRNAGARKQWASGVAKVYRFGEWFVGLLVFGNQIFPILPLRPIDVKSLLPPKDIVEIVVENGLYIFQYGQLDWRRAQLVRGIENKQDLNRDDLIRTWESIRKLYSELPARHPGLGLSGKLATEEG